MVPQRFCLVLGLLVALAEGATRRNIPVEVRYERLEHGNLGVSSKHKNYVKNLEEKVQLSQEELLQAAKHLPVSDNLSLLEQVQEAYLEGFRGLKRNFSPGKADFAPSKEQWEKLERDIKEYFEEQKSQATLKQNQGTPNQNFLQNFINGVQQFFNNNNNTFIQQSQNGTSGDEGTQQQGFFQGILSNFNGEFQNFANNFYNQFQSTQSPTGSNNTTLGDSPPQPPQNFFASFISNVQHAFQGAQPGNNSQADSPNGTSTGGTFVGQSGNFFQQAIQQTVGNIGNIGNTFSQLTQGTQRPQGSADENQQPIQQTFIQSIGNTLSNLIRPPGNPLGNSSSSNPILGQASNIGNQTQQIVGQAFVNNSIPQIVLGASSDSPHSRQEEESLETTTSAN